MWELVSSHQGGTKMEKKGIALSSYLLMRTTYRISVLEKTQLDETHLKYVTL